ncbi:Aminopeptidase Y [Yamadazyma tenuis]|uniref:Peptide hydrolase n=1 Tax=Candida tenuis (strain ATCC 10573 / BCRC 21748 / CBS 615 / JCM 9827 / NBRC 10315 / NRRL Y-1498 / VKM Y-70) TaxID=590646 RepID=G3BD55_CANTC|nr:Zn-dependent exopeptidase [Yamadazyma tenuis ATCC 10573]EGV60244.1 Zn-dependent exopeptidase [Yamadazyma tenuis ATCC 10573]WEJ94514.1 Aminopeptidase Y [Yamadazyma tenuis]
MKLSILLLVATALAAPLAPGQAEQLPFFSDFELAELPEHQVHPHRHHPWTQSKKMGFWDKFKYHFKPEIDSDSLQALISEEALLKKAKKLYELAERSTEKYGHPTRVIDSPGHWATIDYITTQLYKLGGYYNVSVQKFKALDSKISAFSLLVDGEEPKSLQPLRFTPPTPDSKPVHGQFVLVKNYGCSVEDFPANLTAGNIALVERGVCAFGDKSANAAAAGAVAAVIYDKEPLSGTLGAPEKGIVYVPTLSITTADAEKYIEKLTEDPAFKFEVTAYVDSYVKYIKTLNVVAETVFGDHDNVVSLGAHSDSVTEGPGINDDGSGTISLLEVAKALTNFKIKNAVRFAWWAAEEEGLLGSTYYAESLSPEENAKLRLFMDYDMMASPNFEYQIYDANDVDHPNGSGHLKDLYIDFYKSKGLNYTFVPFDGRSDYVGFIDAGIPAGGIATGAEGVKTPEGQEKFGGTVGEWFDPCYHQLCDNIENASFEAWVVSTQLIGHSVATYAKSFDGFPERELSSESVGANHFKYRGASLIV